MNSFTSVGLLLARKTRLDSLSDGLKGRPLQTRDVTIIIMAIAAAVLIAILVSCVLRLYERRRSYSSPLLLFVVLCRTHKLRWIESWLLWQVVRTLGLKEPAEVFLVPERLNPAALGPVLARRVRRLRRLKAKLFAVEEKADDTSGDASGPTTKSREPSSALPPTSSPPTLDVGPWPHQ